MSRLAAVVALGALAGCSARSPAPTPARGAGAEASASAEAGEDDERNGLALGALEEGSVHEGFRATGLYLDDRDRPMGARFVHEHSGFELAYLRIDTAPQGFLWVNTAPESDKGLPHAQEHLLLGKGNKGRHASGVESMSLVDSSAFTANAHTAYHSSAIAGSDVYFDVLAVQLDAFLHPDYTDEEIRREFSHHGVAGDLRLEEKGTVYVEMVSSYNKPGSRAWLDRQATLFGPDHPKAKSAGGIPAAIRAVEPEDIRAFHRDHYRLSNMGLILVLPKDLPPGEVLARMDALLRRLQPEPSTGGPDDRLPPAKPAEEGRVVVTRYPSANPNETVEVAFAWPPRLDLDTTQTLLLEQFLATFAGDVSTNLYRRFIDAETRTIDVDASDVWSWREGRDGFAITVGLSGLAPRELTPAVLADLRDQVRDELRRIASWAPGSPELREFNERFLTSVIASERRARDVLNRPPGFGNRGLRSSWYDHLELLERTPGFRKSLTLAPQHAAVREIVEGPGNPWAGWLAEWHLLDTVPYTFTAEPSEELQEEIETSRRARLEAATRELMRRHGTDDAQVALAAFRAEYDAATAELEKLETRSLTPFVANPPMTLDDYLDFREERLPGSGIPVVSSSFDSMTGAAVSLAVPADPVEQRDLVWLPMLPRLMNEVGVIDRGVPVSASDALQRMRREIQGAAVRWESEPRTRRHELVVTARGVTPDESERALEWAGLLLAHADWRPENLPRMRDVVDQSLEGLRRRTRGREEYWVRDPAGAYTWQSDPLYLATSSFLTARHDALRVRWMLRAPADDAVVPFLERLAGASARLDRAGLDALAAALQGRGEAPAAAATWLRGRDGLTDDALEQLSEVGEDLEAEVPSLPDASLAADWSDLCRRIAADLALPPEAALERLTALRASLLHGGGARAWSVGAAETLERLGPATRRLAGLLSPGRAPVGQRDERPLIWTRLAQRGVDTSRRVFVGFVEPSLTGGVVQDRVPLTSYEDTDEDSVLDLLAGVSYSGYGPHGLFMRTWGAGLAYSNGIRSSPANGEIRYYAERCPTLAETLTFVATVLREAEPDPTLGDYAVAQVFGSRAAGSYEDRAEAMAADLADGRPPRVIRAFREAVLAARDRPDLHVELHERLVPTVGKVIPGLGPRLDEVAGGDYYAVGTEAQLAAYEAWLRTVESPDVVVHRLYPRDFWRAEPFTDEPTPGGDARR